MTFAQIGFFVAFGDTNSAVILQRDFSRLAALADVNS